MRFTKHTSLLATALSVVAAHSAAQDIRLLRFPDVHGDKIAFTYAGDLWIGNLDGSGLARRLTSHANLETNAKFSPDGKWIAFNGSYDGNPDVYVVSVDGGAPKRLTFEPSADSVLDWTPDGRVAYVTANYSPFVPRMFTVHPQGGIPVPSDVEPVLNGSFSPDGRSIAYNTNNSYNFNWRQYRGGTQGVINFWDFQTKKHSKVSTGRENSYWPMWIGDRVYFLSDKNQGTINLYSYDVRNRRNEQITRHGDWDIKNPGFDSKTIVYERDGFLYAYDVASKQEKRLNPKISSDELTVRPRFAKLGGMVTGFALSPSGNRIVIEARGELFSVPAKNGETRNMAPGKEAFREKSPTWSPDGQKVAYLSDESGEFQIYEVAQMGGEAKQITSYKEGTIVDFRYSPDGKKISFSTQQNDLMILDIESGQIAKVTRSGYGNLTSGTYDWSPDSKWLAYIDSGKNLFGRAFLYNVAEGKSHQITEGYFTDSAISFDLNGKYLYLISARTFNPFMGVFDFTMEMQNAQRIYVALLSKDEKNPFLKPSDEEPVKKEGEAAAGEKKDEPRVDLEGIEDRLLALPVAPGSYPFAIGANNGVFFWEGGSLKQYTIGQDQPQTIIAGATGFSFNEKRTKIAYQQGQTIGIVNAAPGQQVGSGAVSLTAVEGWIDPRKEWTQMYWEAWRYYRDRFYDPGFRGLDWNAIGKHYAEFLPHVAHRSDLSYVFGLMIGETGTGHSYVQGGDMGKSEPPIPVGALGADYAVEGDYVKLAKIYRGLNFEGARRGPLGEPGLNIPDGAYLLEIDGRPVRSNQNVHEHLIGKVGRTITIKVNDKPSPDGARELRVSPISSENQLRYIEWVEANRKYVEKASGGKVGYMHVPNTSIQGVIEFIKGFYSQTDKEALIIDERFNGGGMIPTFFIEKLIRKYDTGFRQRNGADIGFPTGTIEGPKVMLINEWAGSGGDMFPWLFKNSGVGKLIGTRTWGGLVGITGSANLVDGGGITAPEFGIYDTRTGKWIAENTGVDPDIEVEINAEHYLAKKDPQLDKAIEVLLEDLRKNPTRQWKRPDFPKMGSGGGR